MNEHTKAILTQILDRFESGDIPDVITITMFPTFDIPSAHWSLMNRLLMLIGQTEDARGYKQWKNVSRQVKKGSKAIYILAPVLKTVTEPPSQEHPDGKKYQILVGFKSVPVYRYEDTEGEEVEYRKLEVPDFPLIEKAKELGVDVKAIGGNECYFGYFSQTNNEIAVATKEEVVFFHELSHAAHAHIKGKLKPGQDPLQEVTAELCAQVLSKIVGRSSSDTLGNSYKYIKTYAEKKGVTPVLACTQVLSDVEKILNFLLKGIKNEKI